MSTPAPDTIYVIVHQDTGKLEIGGGSSTRPRPRCFATRAEAERSLARIRYNAHELTIISYKKAAH